MVEEFLARSRVNGWSTELKPEVDVDGWRPETRYDACVRRASRGSRVSTVRVCVERARTKDLLSADAGVRAVDLPSPAQLEAQPLDVAAHVAQDPPLPASSDGGCHTAAEQPSRRLPMVSTTRKPRSGRWSCSWSGPPQPRFPGLSSAEFCSAAYSPRRTW